MPGTSRVRRGWPSGGPSSPNTTRTTRAGCPRRSWPSCRCSSPSSTVASRRRLRLYPHVRRVLDLLHIRFPLAVVTDGQSAYARAELHQVGLLGHFDPIVVSGNHGYRKPDRRLFQAAAAGMQIAPEHVLYVGNDMYRTAPPNYFSVDLISKGHAAA